MSIEDPVRKMIRECVEAAVKAERQFLADKIRSLRIQRETALNEWGMSCDGPQDAHEMLLSFADEISPP